MSSTSESSRLIRSPRSALEEKPGRLVEEQRVGVRRRSRTIGEADPVERELREVREDVLDQERRGAAGGERVARGMPAAHRGVAGADVERASSQRSNGAMRPARRSRQPGSDAVPAPRTSSITFFRRNRSATVESETSPSQRARRAARQLVAAGSRRGAAEGASSASRRASAVDWRLERGEDVVGGAGARAGRSELAATTRARRAFIASSRAGDESSRSALPLQVRGGQRRPGEAPARPPRRRRC